MARYLTRVYIREGRELKRVTLTLKGYMDLLHRMGYLLGEPRSEAVREGRTMKAFETWRCHICGEERPDDKISVLLKPLIINSQVCGEQNVRYCNDRPACIEGAKDYSFVK